MAFRITNSTSFVPAATPLRTNDQSLTLSTFTDCKISLGARPNIYACRNVSNSSRAQMSAASASAAPSNPVKAPASKTLVCTSLTASTIEKQLEQSRIAAAEGADLVEIRVDLLQTSEKANWQSILPALSVPAIVTNRAAWEGGESKDPERQRLSVLLEAVRQGVSHVDVELKAASEFADLCRANDITFPLKETKLILSHHNFEHSISADDVNHLMDRMRRAGADVCKIAMMAESALDNIIVFKTLAAATGDAVVLAMGDLGQVSRIVAPKFGAYLTFASVAQGDESAPGQVDIVTLLNMYRFRSISSDTPLYGVIGDPVSHSMSPAVHNAAMDLVGAKGAYVPLRVKDEFARFVREILMHGFDGLSVTIPGKVPVIDAMDEMDDVARQIGAMNTVVKGEDGRLKGYNTDWVAAISAVEEQFEDGLNDKRVVCVGAGGAGRALAFGALARGAAHVTIINRSADKAMDLAKELGDKASGMSLQTFNDSFEGAFDVLMNSTSVGMHPKEDSCPIDPDRLSKGMVVFDAVYNPLRTKLIKEAEERGCVTVSGLEMFVRQAAEQFRLWFPEFEPPLLTMREVVLDKLHK